MNRARYIVTRRFRPELRDNRRPEADYAVGEFTTARAARVAAKRELAINPDADGAWVRIEQDNYSRSIEYARRAG